jgi:hypothetical protein
MMPSKAAPLAHADVVGAPRGIAADQHLVGIDHALWIEVGLFDHAGLAVDTRFETAAGAHVHR